MKLALAQMSGLNNMEANLNNILNNNLNRK